MSATILHSAKADSTNTVTLGASVTAGNQLIALATAHQFGGSPPTWTIPSGWTQLGSTLQTGHFGNSSGGIFTKNNLAGTEGASFVFTPSVGDNEQIIILEITGQDTTANNDGFIFTLFNSPTPPISVSVTAGSSGDLIIGIGFNNGNGTLTAGSGFTIAQSTTNANDQAWAESLASGSSGANSVSITGTAISNDAALAGIAIKAAGGGGGGGGATTNNPVPSIHGVPNIPDIK